MRNNLITLPALALLGLTACGLLDSGTIDETCDDLPEGCDGTGDSGTTTVQTIDIAVDTVEPVYGSTDGGDSVIITGGPFSADVQVTFGGEAAEVRTWLDGELRVLTPATSSGGWVEVEVETATGSGSRSQGFRYFRDGTDQTGMLGLVERVSPKGALASGGDTASGLLGFIVPEADASMYDTFADGWESCRRDWSPDLGWIPVDPGAEVLELNRTDGASSLSFAWDSAEQLYNGVDGTGSLPADTLLAGSMWKIDAFGGTELPDFALDQFLQIPSGLEVSSPALDSTSLQLGSEELAFTWGADTASDGLYIVLRLVDGSSGSELERVSCLVEDDGAFTVPSSTFTQWEAGRTLYIKLARTIESFEVLPLNNADTRVIGAYAVVGAATTE